MRRFLFVIHYPQFGGPHNQAVRLAEPLRRRGWETVVLLPDEAANAADRLRAAGVETLTVPLERIRASRSPELHLRLARNFRNDVRRIESVLESEGADLALIGGLHNSQAAFAARRGGRAIVWQILDTNSPVAFRRLAMRAVTRLADVVMSTGREVARVHPGALAFGDRLVPYLPPVDVGEFAPDAGRSAAARAELGLGPSDLVVGTVNNLSPMKGHLTFIRAAALLQRRRPNLRFVLLGAAYEHRSDYTRMLLEEAESLGLRVGGELLVVDPGSRVSQLAPALDLFWLTSEPRSEGIPTTVEEAMALGIPVVAADVGGVREIVGDGETGLLVPPRDPEALVAATEPLLDDAVLRRQMGEAARVRAVADFNLDRCADTHMIAFERALEHRAEPGPKLPWAPPWRR
jgi:glycosyltransferase involved in cell wall biosynthesis